MNQYELEQRYRKLTRLIEAARFTPARREDMKGIEIGIVIHEDLTLWEKMPADPADDEKMIKELCERAQKQAKREA